MLRFSSDDVVYGIRIIREKNLIYISKQFTQIHNSLFYLLYML